MHSFITSTCIFLFVCMHYLSIPGLFIGAMDENGFAFKSGKFQHNDRILACNGIDFTKPKDHTEPVKVIFNRMAQGHLLRIAVGRTVSSPEATDNGGAEVEADDNGRKIPFVVVDLGGHHHFLYHIILCHESPPPPPSQNLLFGIQKI